MKASADERKIGKKARRCGLLTIRESPEIVYPLEEVFIRRKMEEQQPELTSVSCGSRVSAEEVFFGEKNDEEDDLFGVSKELLELKERAKKLSEDLKQLSSAAQDQRLSSHDHTDDFEEIMRRYSDFVESEDENEDDAEESERKVKVTEILQKYNESEFDNVSRESLTKKSPEINSPEKEMKEDENISEEEARAEALETIRNFVPKRPFRPSPMFPDLSLKNEKELRNQVGGSSHWQMPFRNSVYEALTKRQTSVHPNNDSSDEESEETQTRKEQFCQRPDPTIFAPTGDVYSYFVRRRVTPTSFALPLRYELANALGGASRKFNYVL